MPEKSRWSPAAMSTADQKDRVPSPSEDSLRGLQTSKSKPPPFLAGHAGRRGSVPCSLPGCVQVQPMSSHLHADGNGVNGIGPGTAAWTGQAAGPLDAKQLYSSRIMKLFSNGRKGSFPPDGPSSGGGSGNGAPPSWPGLSGLGVVDSFKKLRSSVLQGIQSRGAASSNGDGTPCDHQGADATDAAPHRNVKDGHRMSNGTNAHPRASTVSQNGSDYEDLEDEENDEGLQRNSRFSRSIRRAYGVGRISLHDSGNVRLERHSVADATSRQMQSERSKVSDPTEDFSGNANVKVLTRLSKSAENLHLLKLPFKRKSPSPGPQSDPEGPGRGSGGASNIQRTVSASSVDLQGPSRRRSPIRAKEQMLKLVGSMSDLAGWQWQSSASIPSPTTPLSPTSRLHDDYSRRLPCVPACERQRRPQAQVPEEVTRRTRASVEHVPLIHPQPERDAAVPQHLATVSPETPEPSPPTPSRMKPDWPHIGLGGGPNRTEDTAPPSEASSEQQSREALLQTTEIVPPVDSSTPPLSPESLPESPASPIDTSSVRPRRRTARPRPRPISDYGQLVSRKYPIPEEEAELGAENRTPNGTFHKDRGGNGGCETDETCGVNGDVNGNRQRPQSMIGVVDLFPADAEEKEDRLPSPLSRPPIPSHQVPPYRGVSARFRPSALSQSTPIGLDRLGRRVMHRVLSEVESECASTLDDSVSEEEEGSFDELTDATPHLEPGVELCVLNEWISSGHAVYAEAHWDHVTMEEQELAFKAGDVIRVLDAPHVDWWWGRGADREAWFPSSFVRVRVNQEDSSAESVESVAEDPAPRDTHSSQHREQMRTNVVQEIMNTERIYIKHLKDICEGYIRQCRKHPDMFTEPQLRTIFSNIEEIYRFQRQFLRDLEKKYNKDHPHLSGIGSCFLLQGEGFSIYSEYCNTHPAACAELQRLMKLGRYKHFFEACRLLQQMIDISIAGFLLTPVQKICKYPLQLGELLKYTPKDHSDFSGVSEAYEAMKNVASLINERKRRLESVDTIAHWQVAILHWEGPDVLERSSELIHCGELTRIVRQGKMHQRSFFLFDHQLVVCKKDILRRDLLHYRERLDMDRTEVVDVPDGRNADLGLTLKNALRLRNAATLESVCVLCCRKAQDKQRWLEAFQKERRRVKEDQEMGMEISAEQRKQAIVNARRAKKGKTISYSSSIPPHHQNLHPLHQRHVTIPTSVPQQQVFSLAEPPKRKPYHVLYSITRSALFRK